MCVCVKRENSKNILNNEILMCLKYQKRLLQLNLFPGIEQKVLTSFLINNYVDKREEIMKNSSTDE